MPLINFPEKLDWNDLKRMYAYSKYISVYDEKNSYMFESSSRNFINT